MRFWKLNVSLSSSFETLNSSRLLARLYFAVSTSAVTRCSVNGVVSTPPMTQWIDVFSVATLSITPLTRLPSTIPYHLSPLIIWFQTSSSLPTPILARHIANRSNPSTATSTNNGLVSKWIISYHYDLFFQLIWYQISKTPIYVNLFHCQCQYVKISKVFEFSFCFQYSIGTFGHGE